MLVFVVAFDAEQTIRDVLRRPPASPFTVLSNPVNQSYGDNRIPAPFALAFGDGVLAKGALAIYEALIRVSKSLSIRSL